MAIKNYLKDVKEITAPLNWKSSPDSPPTQLAYVTKPEIDLLVKANLHGSMDGKPNKGPKGIISLDGGGIEEAYSEKISDKPFSSNVISSGSNASPHGGDNFPIIGGSGSEGSGSEGSGSGMSSIGQTIFNVTNQGSGSGQDGSGQDGSGQQDGGDQDDTKTETEETPKNKIKAKVKKLGDWFDENVFGEPIEKLDAEKRKEVLDKLKEFQKLDVGLFKSFMLNRGNAIAGLFGKDQTYSDMEGNVIDPNFVFDNPTGEGGLMGLNEDGEYVDVRYTKEGFSDLMEKTFGKGIFETLKRDEPQVYYPFAGMPATSGGLLNLADNAAINTTGMDRESDEYKEAVQYNNMIFAARAELDRMGKNYLTGNPQGGGGQPQGIMGIAPPPTDEVAPKPPGSRPPSYPIFGPQPPFMPGPVPPFMPGPPFGDKFERPRPYNYFAQSPQYRFRGIPSVNTDAFNEQLRKLYGVA